VRGTEVVMRLVFYRNPEPQRIFQGEHDERDHLDGDEQRPISRTDVRNGLQRDRDEVDEYEENERGLSRNAGPRPVIAAAAEALPLGLLKLSSRARVVLPESGSRPTPRSLPARRRVLSEIPNALAWR
jgi:hypothetical protein